jgi:hypothetical protein
MNLSLKASIAGVLALTFAAGVAFAQPPAAGGGGGGGGGGRGAALRAACGADIQKFCPNLQPGPDLRACVRKNYASLSDGCRAQLDQMRSQRQQQQQQGGGAAAPQ